MSSITNRLMRLLPDFRRYVTVAYQPNAVQAASFDEKCILVDELDRPIGTDTKRNCHAVVNGGLLLHRAFSVFLFNTNDELLLQQRSATKITFPNRITNTCCSHPLYDIVPERDTVEGVKIAARRRLHFELGIPPSLMPLDKFQFITRLHYFSIDDGQWGEHEIDYILVLRGDFPLCPNPDEVRDVFYVSRSKMLEFTEKAQHPLTPWFQLTLKHLLFHWWDNLNRLQELQDDKIHKFEHGKNTLS